MEMAWQPVLAAQPCGSCTWLRQRVETLPNVRSRGWSGNTVSDSLTGQKPNIETLQTRGCKGHQLVHDFILTTLRNCPPRMMIPS